MFLLLQSRVDSPLLNADSVTVSTQTARDNMDSENGKSHLQKTQEEVEEVKVIMLQNMNKAEERSGKLNELEDRADLLLEESKKFEKTSTQVKTQKRWANKKMKVVLIAVAVVAGLIILSLIIVAIVQSTKGSD